MEVELLKSRKCGNRAGRCLDKHRSTEFPPVEQEYLQQSEEQGHMLGVLNEPVCELGSQVICLLLGILICEGDPRLKLVTSPVQHQRSD